ncbi:PIN domain-containing protein [Thiohalorhabdus sp.]|uniref:PIN domain-containing protein n=1 Tax=Thiohalorhabdus sp. TaxID=3094134 RepID=UPI002FC29D8D
MAEIILDTSVIVSGLRAGGGQSRSVLRRAISGMDTLLLGTTLWLEYEAVLERTELDTFTTREERATVLASLAAAGRWVRIYYGWRPNLPDEADNHLIELAVAGGGQSIVTWNLRDLEGGELIWPELKILSPPQFLKEMDP